MTTPRTPPSTVKHTWAFKARFRRGAFGWKGSRLAIERIDEALREISLVARADSALAAEGAVSFLERLSPAVSGIDSSSGSLGNATWSAAERLVPLIAHVEVSDKVRGKWLERLFDAMQEDDPPYLENLGDHWGSLCATPALASEWVDQLLPIVHSMLSQRAQGVFGFFVGTNACLSALYAANRHDELLAVLAMDPKPFWPYLKWAGKVLVARGQIDEAIALMAQRSGMNTDPLALAQFAEEALLSVNRRKEAFNTYALLANQAQSHIGTYRALAKKYPELDPQKLFAHLVAAHPGEEGKWFATAKTLKLFEEATRLAWASPCDSRTLTRAAKTHATTHPVFALECALAAVYWVAMGHGYDLTPLDVTEPWDIAQRISQTLGKQDRVSEVLEVALVQGRQSAWVRTVLRIP